jgi:dTDP-4-dehydrorhamnose 3,5-epimerase-like enzyme
MAYLIDVPTFSDERGNLTVIEKIIPFEIKRIFYIYGVDDSVRGGHRHHKTIQAAFCIRGSCIVSNNNGIEERDYLLDRPNKGLIIEPRDWHTMHHFTTDAVFMVLASETYSPEDYIREAYP